MFREGFGKQRRFCGFREERGISNAPQCRRKRRKKTRKTRKERAEMEERMVWDAT